MNSSLNLLNSVRMSSVTLALIASVSATFEAVGFVGVDACFEWRRLMMLVHSMF